jgi:hypothetical protein
MMIPAVVLMGLGCLIGRGFNVRGLGGWLAVVSNRISYKSFSFV